MMKIAKILMPMEVIMRVVLFLMAEDNKVLSLHEEQGGGTYDHSHGPVCLLLLMVNSKIHLNALMPGPMKIPLMTILRVSGIFPLVL